MKSIKVLRTEQPLLILRGWKQVQPAAMSRYSHNSLAMQTGTAL